VKLALVPGITVWLDGCDVNVGAKSTLSVAGLLATLLSAEFEATHRYWWPFIAAVTPVIVSVPVAVPVKGAVSVRLVHAFPLFVLTCH
jgi:hypothetical protein